MPFMTAVADPTDAPPKKKSSKLPLVIGLVLAILGGAGGFMSVKLGFLGGHAEGDVAADLPAPDAPMLAPAAFVALDPVIINLSNQSGRLLLRFAAQLEVAPEYQHEVEAIRPRIVDLINGYLRALELRDIEDPAALIRIRAQLLRRIQVVTGRDRVRNLLIIEFVLTGANP